MSRLFWLAFRNVLRNKGRSALAAVALLVGVSQMVYGQGGINGMVKALIEDAVLSRVGAIQVYRAGYLDAEQDPLTFDLPGDPAFVARLQAVAGVRSVSRRIYFEGMMGNGNVSTVFVATAIDPATEYDVCPRRRQLVAAGSAPLAPGNETGILIGSALAEGLGAGKGATLYASSATQAGVPNALDVTIHGMLPEGSRVDSKAGAVVPLALAQSLLRMPQRVTEYVLNVDDLERVDEVANGLRRALGDGFEVKTWRDRQQIREFVKTFGFIMVFVGFLLSILVASVIVNTMLMTVYERVREIGTMLAIGVRRREVMMIFLIESATIGLGGAVAGAGLGWGLVRLSSGRITFPATELSGALTIFHYISIHFLLATIVGALVVSILAALYPAWKASRMKPVDALRAL